MREKIISILSELRPEFDFSEPVNLSLIHISEPRDCS